MRKTFLTFCVAALSLLAVSSCGKIEDSLHQLEEGLANLTERVAALEKKLNDEVATINTKIGNLEQADKDIKALIQTNAASITNLTSQLDALDGKVDGFIKTDAAAILKAIEDLKTADKALADKDAELLAALVGVGVTKVEKNAAGNAVLTFVDGSTLEVPAQPETGVVTVVEVEGVKYWAVVVNGEAQSLGVPVGHVALKFKVDYNDNSLQYSVDNGATWKSTGAYVASDEYYLFSDFYQGGEMDPETWEYVEHDYYTLVFGGEEYYLPIYKVDNSVVALKSGKTYFTYGESKEFELNLRGISDCYVMSKPDGWKAKVAAKVLAVTAPAEEIVELGVADLEGEVLLHATTEEGKCKIVKLAVSTNSGLTVSVDAAGMITVVNPFAYPVPSSEDDELGGMPMPMPMPMNDEPAEEEEDFVPTHEFASFVLGIAPVDKFSADPVGYAKGCISGDIWDAICAYDFYQFRNQFYVKGEDGKYTDELKYAPVPYKEGVYEVDECTFDIADFYYYFTYDELAKGEHFVVWAAPYDEENNVVIDDLTYVYYEPVAVDVKLKEASFSDIEVSLNLFGAEKFLVGYIAESAFVDYGFTFDEYMNMRGEGPFSRFQTVGADPMYAEYAENYLGASLENGTEGDYFVSTLNAEGYGDVLAPGTKYYVWAMPVVAGLSYADYDYETNFKPYVFEFETAALEYSASSAASVVVDYTTTPKTISATVEVEGAMMAYYMMLEGGVYRDYMTGDSYDVNEMTAQEIAELLIASGTPRNEFPFTVYEQGLDPESEHTLIVLAVDENGLYGDPVLENITTEAIKYATDFSVEFKSYDAATGTATFDVTGNAQKVVCYHAYYDTYTTNVVNWLLDYGYEYVYFKSGDVSNGAATVTGFTGSNQWIIYVGYAEDADGTYTFTEPKVAKISE